jgi:UDP-GlcNAc:undecaprenyl-phosphate GlcNAc-1-phosphate transferase
VFKLPKLFLGDSGSLSLGFIVSFILIYFANQEIAHPIILAWSVSIFVFEFLSLNIQRIKKKKYF